MNWKTIKALTAFIALSASSGIAAQNISDSVPASARSVHDLRTREIILDTHVIGENGQNNRDSLNMLLYMFYYDQFHHFQDPRAPYFMFLSKSGDLALGVGGQVKVKGYFDWNGSIPSINFSPYEIPIPKVPADTRDLAATPQGTGLFFTLLGSNRRFGKYMAYIQADFSGYNHRGFRLKKAYLTIGDWTAGYTTSTFEDTKAELSTVDGAGPNGITSRKNVLVRYLHSFRRHFTIAASLEFPSQSIDIDNGNYTAEANPFIPDLAAFAQYQWDGGNSHVRLSGLLRSLEYRDLLQQKNHTVTGWGLQVSSVINPVAPLDIFGIVSAGRGHASYTTDLGNGNYDLINKGDTGKMEAPFSLGYVIGLQYFFNADLYSNIGFSQQYYFPGHINLTTDKNIYKYGLYGVGNLFWSVTPRFDVGIEYLYGLRRNMGGAHASADRLMLQMMLSF